VTLLLLAFVSHPQQVALLLTGVNVSESIYNLLLNGQVMGSVVRAGHRSTNTTWTAELLEDLPRTKRPALFKNVEHDFATLEEVRAWLGNPPVQSNFGRSSTAR
jgi:hypothetical protein